MSISFYLTFYAPLPNHDYRVRAFGLKLATVNRCENKALTAEILAKEACSSEADDVYFEETHHGMYSAGKLQR